MVEAAGYDVVIVETVGVGQSESAVASMVDSFVMLMVPGTGTRSKASSGVLELADIIAVNKADGDRVAEAGRVARELAEALHLFGTVSPSWEPPVLTCSAQEGTGIDRLWDEVVRHREVLTHSGEFDEKRDRQLTDWMWSLWSSGCWTGARRPGRARADTGGRERPPRRHNYCGPGRPVHRRPTGRAGWPRKSRVMAEAGRPFLRVLSSNTSGPSRPGMPPT